MAKIMIDHDAMGNNLIPQAKIAKTNISSAHTLASQVDMPNNDYNWSHVVSQLEDCEEALKKYNSWIGTINTKYKNGIVRSVDTIKRVEIENVNFIEMTVK